MWQRAGAIDACIAVSHRIGAAIKRTKHERLGPALLPGKLISGDQVERGID